MKSKSKESKIVWTPWGHAVLVEFYQMVSWSDLYVFVYVCIFFGVFSCIYVKLLRFVDVFWDCNNQWVFIKKIEVYFKKFIFSRNYPWIQNMFAKTFVPTEWNYYWFFGFSNFLLLMRVKGFLLEKQIFAKRIQLFWTWK